MDPIVKLKNKAAELNYGTFNAARTFWEDHEDRGCTDPSEGNPAAIVVARKARVVTIVADPAVLAELFSDAVHYSDDAYSDYPGLMASAKGTVRQLDKLYPEIGRAHKMQQALNKAAYEQRKREAALQQARDAAATVREIAKAKAEENRVKALAAPTVLRVNL